MFEEKCNIASANRAYVEDFRMRGFGKQPHVLFENPACIRRLIKRAKGRPFGALLQDRWLHGLLLEAGFY
jgi:hypothetical protein